MNKQHTDTLFAAAPILYSGRKETIKTNLMPFGFMCGDGWFYPLMKLSWYLEAMNVEYRRYRVFIKAVEVKEKFGTLRFYFDVYCGLPWHKRLWNWITRYRCIWGETHDQRVIRRVVEHMAEKLVDLCEQECLTYCEDCGKQFGDWNKDERVTTVGWINYICKECAEKNNRKYVPFGQDPYLVTVKSDGSCVHEEPGRKKDKGS